MHSTLSHDVPQPLFIVNPAAGNGRAQRIMRQVSAAFLGPAEVVSTTMPGDAENLAYQGALAGFSPIVGVGGDGTLQEIVNGLMRSPDPPPLGIVAAGSGNDVVRGLRLPSNPAEATRRIWSGAAGEIDVAMCNERYFLNVGGAGLDTQVALAMNKRGAKASGGKLAYFVFGLKELRRYSNPEFVLHLDGRVLTTRSLLVAVANGRFLAGGMMICPEADPADGFLDVCVAGDLSRREALTLLPKIYFGRHARHPKVSFHRVRNVRIECPPGLDVQLDGEIAGTLPAEFRIVPCALSVVGWGGAAVVPSGAVASEAVAY